MPPPPPRTGLWVKMWSLVAPVVVVGAMILAWRLLPVENWVRVFVREITDLGALGVVLFGLTYVLGVLVLAPASVMSIAAGVAYGWWGVPFVLASGTASAAASFLVARYLARDRVERMLAERPLFRAIGRAIDDEGWRVVGLVRLSAPIPFAISNYLFGVTNVGFWPFVLTTAVCILPVTSVYVNLGAMGHAVTTGGATDPWQWALLGVGMVATVLAGVLVARKTREKLREAGAEAQT